MTEDAPRKRTRKPTSMPLLPPGLYAVGRFGDLHDVLGTDWLGDMADADLAALEGYLELALSRRNTEERRRATPVEIGLGTHFERQPDLRDQAYEPSLKAAEDTAWLNRRQAEGKPTALSEIMKLPAELGDLPPSIEQSLADLKAGRSVPVRRPRTAAEPADVEVIEETLGTKPVGGRPAMPWDE